MKGKLFDYMTVSVEEFAIGDNIDVSLFGECSIEDVYCFMVGFMLDKTSIENGNVYGNTDIRIRFVYESGEHKVIGVKLDDFMRSMCIVDRKNVGICEELEIIEYNTYKKCNNRVKLCMSNEEDGKLIVESGYEDKVVRYIDDINKHKVSIIMRNEVLAYDEMVEFESVGSIVNCVYGPVEQVNNGTINIETDIELIGANINEYYIFNDCILLNIRNLIIAAIGVSIKGSINE